MENNYQTIRKISTKIFFHDQPTGTTTDYLVAILEGLQEWWQEGREIGADGAGVHSVEGGADRGDPT